MMVYIYVNLMLSRLTCQPGTLLDVCNLNIFPFALSKIGWQNRTIQCTQKIITVHKNRIQLVQREMMTDECILSVKDILQMLNLPFSLESVCVIQFGWLRDMEIYTRYSSTCFSLKISMATLLANYYAKAYHLDKIGRVFRVIIDNHMYFAYSSTTVKSTLVLQILLFQCTTNRFEKDRLAKQNNPMYPENHSASSP